MAPAVLGAPDPTTGSFSMKLYVWDSPGNRMVGRSFLVVVAETEEKARYEARRQAPHGYVGYAWGESERFSKLGPPLEIYEAPVAVYCEYDG